MKILVCFKIVKDMDYVLDSDWKNYNASDIDLSYVKDIISCFDEGALENSLRFKDSMIASGKECEVTALTIGDGYFDNFFKNLFALGVKDIIQVKGCGSMDFNSKMISEIIHFASDLHYNIIALGNEDSTSNTGMTGFYLADKLKYPYISNVNELSYQDDGVALTKNIDGGLMYGKITGDCVLSFSNSNNPYLRFSTLRDRLKVSSKTATTVDVNDLAIDLVANELKLQSLTREESEIECNMLSMSVEDNVQYVVDSIISGVVK